MASNVEWKFQLFLDESRSRVHTDTQGESTGMNFRADGDHAMCNIQNRTIPIVQLRQLQKQSAKNFQGTGALKI
jgi:hypothetical protein